ncbi:MAG: YybH family protein [Candidatus Acidiferrales bacterium]
MGNDLHDFEQFMKQREDASKAFVNGDIGPLDRIATRVSPATLFGPNGDCIAGADKVNAANESGAKLFTSGSDTSFEIFQMAAKDGIAFWTGIQRATLRMHGKANAIQMDLRITEVFRREGNEWKLVHRHADHLKSQSGPK